MTHHAVTNAGTNSWNPPDTRPTEVGEYRAALAPADASQTVRRWWDGKRWSRPYHVHWDEEIKAQCRATSDDFFPYWLSNG
jgi:hypothetical protein